MSTYIDKNETIGVGTCYCRQASKLVGEDTHDMPMEVCMWFGNMAEYAIERLGARKMTPAEAKKVLDTAEEAGLVHPEAILMESKPDFPAPPKDPKELITSIKASFAKKT